jgi:AsmA protein
MGKYARYALIAIGAVVVLIAVVAVSLPLFLNADSFRTKIEATLSQSLGRKVTIGKLELSVWSGSLVAQNTTTADDPRFSTAPFIDAEQVKIGVEMLPLIFDKQVVIRGITMQSPKVQLLRAADGTWNYSTIGTNKPATQSAEAKSTFPNLTVDKIDIENGRITVGGGPGTTGVVSRVYEQVNLSVRDFSFTKAFPFSVTASLPAGGSIKADGTAGPINQKDASATPFAGHLEMKHVDPLAAGFVEASDGVTGLVDSLVLDAAWNGTQMHISKLEVDSPQLTLVHSTTPKQPKPANAEGASMLQNLFVNSAQIKNGTITLATAGQTGKPAVYGQVNAQITNLTPTTASPFTASAVLPGGGSFSATGQAGPFKQASNASTPVNANVVLKHVELGSAGVMPGDAGIGGVADAQAHVLSNGQTLNATGALTVVGIKLANGTPSPKPVQVQFNVAQNEQASSGTIQQAVITVGRAVVNVSGTYQTSGPSTALNLKVVGNGMPIDEIEAFLPALGVHLPQGSRLQGGTLTTSLMVSGSSASPTISGPVQVSNTQLAGFDLGSKLNSLSQLTGGAIGRSTGPGTNIRSLSMNVTEQGGAIRTDKVALDVAGVGTATGAGTVSAGGALNYNMVLKLTGLAGGGSSGGKQQASAGGTAGLVGALSGFIPASAGGAGAIGGVTSSALKNGIPVAIGGTTSNPTFTPNLAGVGASVAQGLLNGSTTAKKPANGTQANPLGNALGGLLGHH